MSGATHEDLARTVRAVGVALSADRCWLYARDPGRRRGIAAVRWLRTPATTDVPDDLHAWIPESPDLDADDPLFARALAGEPLDVIDDATRGLCNPALERTLGHTALVHLNLQVDGVLWGTLQPGMTSGPRQWSQRDRAVLVDLRQAVAATVRTLVRRHGDALPSRRLVG